MCRIVCCAVLRLQLQVHRTSFFIFVFPCRSRGVPQCGDVGHVMEVSGVKASFEDAEDGEAVAITETDGLLVQKQGKSMPWLSPLRDCVAEKESKEVG